MVKATIEFWRFRAMHVVVEDPCEQSRSVCCLVFDIPLHAARRVMAFALSLPEHSMVHERTSCLIDV